MNYTRDNLQLTSLSLYYKDYILFLTFSSLIVLFRVNNLITVLRQLWFFILALLYSLCKLNINVEVDSLLLLIVYYLLFTCHYCKLGRWHVFREGSRFAEID